MIRIGSISSIFRRYIPRAVKHSKGFENCDFSKKFLLLEYVHYNTKWLEQLQTCFVFQPYVTSLQSNTKSGNHVVI